MTHFVIVGLGSIGRRHARNLSAFAPDARITVVRHRGGEDDLCRELGARVVTTIDDVEGDVDLAVLATPSANHMDALPRLIESGWPLLVEKPVVADRRECDVVRSLLATAPTAVRVAGFNMRHLPSLGRMHELVASGELGTIARASFIAGQWLPDWRPGTDYRTCYSADVRRGGGVELDLSHEFDIARWLFGDLSVEFARSGTFSDLEIHSSDTAVAVLAPVGGTSPLVTVALDYVARRRVRWYEVVGDRGRVEWSIDGRLDLSTADGTRSIAAGPADFDVASTYQTMIDGVLRAVRSADDSATQSLEDGLASTQLALDVRDQGGRR